MKDPVPQSLHARIDRFHLLQCLGRSAQGVVYVGYDPQLDRQVAIKTLEVGATDPHQAEMLLAAARTLSKSSHPNIVPVFEVGMHAGQPFVVFEYVEGRTLAAILRAGGALPMSQAVVMMSQILAGIAHLHASGVLHGDIKPANVLIGASGIPRVTDFGISHCALATEAAVRDATAQYLAPECVHEGRADYGPDVFALGLLFCEMLTGHATTSGTNGYTEIYQALNEAFEPPSAVNPRVDRRLDAIVLKALQRDPNERYADATQMKRDLDRFRVPGGACETHLEDQSVERRFDPLLRKMALQSDFPVLSTSLQRINQLCAQGDEASLRAMADLVMRDFALMQKVLQLVNSTAFGVGKVTRMTQAAALLGLSRLSTVVAALILAGGGRSGPRCPAVSAALTDAFVAGVIARNVGRMTGLGAVEELFVSGMFSRLGHILALYYLREEHQAVLRRIADEGIEAEAAARAVLGLTFEELGMAVARHWNFPEAIARSMRPLASDMPLDAGSEAQRAWLCAGFARELCTLARECSLEQIETAFRALMARFQDVLPVASQPLRKLIAHSVEAASHYMEAAELRPTQTALLDGLRTLAHYPQTEALEARDGAVDHRPQSPASCEQQALAQPRMETVALIDRKPPQAPARSPSPPRRH